jgi:hypothetical protein
VEGWEATPTVINQGARTIYEEHAYTDSYFVHKCPEFKRIIPKNQPPKKKWYEK